MAGRQLIGRAVGAACREHDPEPSDRELLRRFADGDEAAFASLARRHTGMVLGVCRRALPTVQDAEDACQATFLILARKARSRRWHDSVANWLYTTARRVARNALVTQARRERREVEAATRKSVAAADRLAGGDVFGILDEELNRLPARYREPLILCYLQGLARDEAASRLGLPLTTLKTRLERGRKRLGAALTKRGCVGAGLLAAATAPSAAALASRISATALASIHRATGFSIKLAGPLLVGVALLGVGLTVLPAAGPPADKRPAPPTITFAGRVLSPEGKPVGGASLRVVPRSAVEGGFRPIDVAATSGRDGRFCFSVVRSETEHLQTGMPMPATVVASAAGYSPGWAYGAGDITLRLGGDGEKISGRVVTLEGRPVAVAIVHVKSVAVPRTGKLDSWLAAVRLKRHTGKEPLGYFHPGIPAGALPGAVTRIRTDADGKFVVTGFGRGRLLTAIVEVPGVATQSVRFVIRKGVGKSVIAAGSGVPIYGTSPTVVLPPSRPITGVVRDQLTGRALAGVVVQSVTLAGSSSLQIGTVRTRTGANGRYILKGVPTGTGNTIAAVPPTGDIHLPAQAAVPVSPGNSAAGVDFSLLRGVRIEGVVRDDSGRPVPNACVTYFADEANRRAGDLPMTPTAGKFTKADGRFQTVGLTGGGEQI